MRASIRWLASLVAALFASGCVVVTGSFELFETKPQALEERVVAGERGPKILLVEVGGPITSQERREGLGLTLEESTLARLQAELDKARDDKAVAAVVLRINSPGGTVTASDAIFHELMRFKAERGLPLIAYFLDIGASGAYYAALAADEILASPTTVTGSIGAVVYGVNVRGLMRLVGIENQTLKAGEKKDIGSPLREMTAEEREILQSVIDGMRDRFVAVVRQRRPRMTAAAIDTIADGRVFAAEQAQAIGLIDGIGYLPDAIDAAKRRAGIEQARVVMYRRPRQFAETIYSQALPASPQVNLVRVDGAPWLPSPSFLYMWLPQVE